MIRSIRRCRRRFLRQAVASATAGVAAPLLLPSRVVAFNGEAGPNDQVGLAAVGVGRRGAGVFRNAVAHPTGRAIAVADVNTRRAENTADRLGGKPYQDYRKLLERKDVDAIVTATPDHWRALVCIHAAQAGKDIYAEKPMTLTIAEGRRMVEAVRKHKRVFQTGSQQRSMRANRFGCELVRGGRLGKLKTVLGANYASPWSFAFPAQPVPEGLDWDMWCGPVEPVPQHVDVRTPRGKPGWVSERRFSGGEMTAWGAHGLDQIQWALGKDDTGPTEVWTEGEPFDEPHFTEPHTRGAGERQTNQPIVHFRYADGTTVKLDGGNPGGALFIGERGKIEIFRDRIGTNPDALKNETIGEDEVHLYRSDDHVGNWLQCIKTRERCVADVEIGHRSATLCHLGNIARWTGRPLKWDPAKEHFLGDAAANEYLDRPRRKGYELPSV